MKSNALRLLCWAVLVLLTSGSSPEVAGAQAHETIREPILAGAWYPADPEELRGTIHAFLSHAENPLLGGELHGLIVPHAGYSYSGRVAAHGYRLLQGSDFRRVVLIGPSHRMGFGGVSVDQRSGYKTPLGVVPVDREFAKRLLKDDPFMAWIPQAHDREHSLEIQVPFLQVVLPDALIVPLVMGRQDLAACERLASTLVREIGADRNTLIVASSDLSHFHGDERARSIDKEFLRHLLAYDSAGLVRSLSEGKCEACGAGPVLVALLAGRGAGADRTLQLSYATSGDATGDRTRVVGYASAALFKKPGWK